nr:T9SS type A sorting domain-containing protein [Bacteroidota bacterium]
VETDAFFGGPGTVNIVKEVAGTSVYWPEYSINSLTHLEPGKSYWISVSENTSLFYPDCGELTWMPQPTQKPANITPWNDVNYTAVSHLIVISEDVMTGSGIQTNDIIGVFASEGLCVGLAEMASMNNSYSLVAFMNDETTHIKDGYDENGLISMKLYRPETGKECTLSVEFDQQMPYQANFSAHGLSKIQNIEMGVFGLEEIKTFACSIYPNPSKGELWLYTDIPESDLKVEISDTKGRIVPQNHFSIRIDNGAYFLNISNLLPGIYFFSISDGDRIQVQKVVIF